MPRSTIISIKRGRNSAGLSSEKMHASVICQCRHNKYPCVLRTLINDFSLQMPCVGRTLHSDLFLDCPWLFLSFFGRGAQIGDFLLDGITWASGSLCITALFFDHIYCMFCAHCTRFPFHTAFVLPMFALMPVCGTGSAHWYGPFSQKQKIDNMLWQ